MKRSSKKSRPGDRPRGEAICFGERTTPVIHRRPAKLFARYDGAPGCDDATPQILVSESEPDLLTNADWQTRFTPKTGWPHVRP